MNIIKFLELHIRKKRFSLNFDASTRIAVNIINNSADMPATLYKGIIFPAIE